jgi:hypothetical protein
MKVIYCLVIIVFNFSNFIVLNAQSLKFRAAGSYDFHLTQSETTAENTPFENQQDLPSVAAFFDDNSGLNLDISFRFGNQNTDKGQLFFGIMHERTTVNSNSAQGKLILGEKLIQKKYTPYIGFGGYTDPKMYYVFVYGFGGLTIKSYKGEGNLIGEIDNQDTNFDVEYNYSNSAAFRVGAGVDFENLGDYPITLGCSIYADLGSISREKSDIYYNGKKVGEFEPTGQNSLYDNTIYISLSLAYQLNFE